MGFVVFIVIVVIVVSVIASIKSTEKARNNWQSAAHTLGLTHVPGSAFSPGMITGVYGAHSVDVSTFTRGSGKNSRRYTKFRVTYGEPINFQFKLKKQNVLHNIGKMLGMQDIEVGDKSFDDAALVQGADRQALLRFLTAPRRHAILSALGGYQEISITNQSIEVNERGLQSDPSLVVGRIRDLAQLADAITRNRDMEHPIEKANAARSQGNLDEAMEHLESAVFDDRHDKLEAMEIEGELHYLAGQKQEAAIVFEGLTQELPGDTQSAEWATMASGDVESQNASVPPELPAETQPIDSRSEASPAGPAEESPEASQSKAVTAGEFCARLFDSGLGTLDSTRAFENEYQGSLVEWDGTLVAVSEFSVDFVFKNKTGVKATFELQDLQSAYGGGKAKAIVHFPESQLESLGKSLHQNVPFSGKLLSMDALMKNVFLTDGRLS